MSLELALQQNTAAIEALTQLLKGGAVPAPAPVGEQPASAESTKTTRTKPKKTEATAPADDTAAVEGGDAAPAASTYAEASAKVVEVANKKGRQAAVEILGRFGGAKKLGEVDPSKFAAVIAACDEVLA